MRRVRVAAIPLLLACAPRAGTTPPLPEAQPAHVRTLPGGTRLLVVEDRAATSVLVSLVVPAGTRHDPPGKEGLAHLVEHLTFRARMESGQRRVDVVKRAGGDFNAWTRDEETLDVEREVIRNELRSRGLDVAAAEVLKEMLFAPEHPWRSTACATSPSTDRSRS